MSSIDESDWINRAACTEIGTEAFFTPDDIVQSWEDRQATVRMALDVCRGCEVKVECLADAIRTGDRYGIRGGTTERQRAKMINDYEAPGAKASKGATHGRAA